MSSPIAYKPPKPPMTLVRAPRMGEVYWCDFSISNCLPEFDDRHLILVLKSGGYKDACHMVIPLTKQDQSKNAYGHPLTFNPSPSTARTSWAVCDQIYTVATERLSRLRNRRHEVVQPFKLPDDDLAAIGRLTFRALQNFFAIGYPPADD